jgi:hypothetical protein
MKMLIGIQEINLTSKTLQDDSLFFQHDITTVFVAFMNMSENEPSKAKPTQG